MLQTFLEYEGESTVGHIAMWNKASDSTFFAAPWPPNASHILFNNHTALLLSRIRRAHLIFFTVAYKEITKHYWFERDRYPPAVHILNRQKDGGLAWRLLQTNFKKSNGIVYAFMLQLFEGTVVKHWLLRRSAGLLGSSARFFLCIPTFCKRKPSRSQSDNTHRPSSPCTHTKKLMFQPNLGWVHS